MAFDKVAYLEGYLRPKSRQKPQGLQDDLFERYAIPSSLAVSDTEIVETIRAVRSVWNSQQRGSLMWRYAKLCLGDDERLKALKPDAGPAKGKDMHTKAWWQDQKQKQEGAARDRIVKLSALLKDSNGAFGVVTRSYLARCAERVCLDASQANQAVTEAGLRVVDDVNIPGDPPIAQYNSLENDLGVGGAATIVDLIHPDSGPFKIVEGFESVGDPRLRLDAAGVASQIQVAARMGTGATWTARGTALNTLRSAVDAKVDLRAITLYHLAQAATGGGVPGAAGMKAELVSRGVEEQDANVLAVVLADRAGTSAVSTARRIDQLLQDGRLREATSLAQSLPQDGSNATQQLLARLQSQRERCDALLDEARRLLGVPDEVGAAAKVREAEAISSEDAEAMMALVPLPPPRDLCADVDGSTVRLHWQPNVGHSEATTYLVVRSQEGAPSSPASGSPLSAPTGTTATDPHAPVARPIYYSVFASVPGRPSSRPANAALVLAPPVLDARCDAGSDRLVAHWVTHPSVHHVEVVRTDSGAKGPVPVDQSSTTIAGLPEGISVHLQVTAVYEAPDGSMLRSMPVILTGTPRAAAKPLENLKAQPITGPTGVQVRLSWTPVDRSQIRIKRHSSAPSWNTGVMVTPEEMANWGQEVTGPTEKSMGVTRLDTTLPPGIHYLVPFSFGGTGIVVGRGVSVGVTDAVSGLVATPFKGFARLAWTWPSTSTQAEVSWERDDNDADAVGLERLTRAEYDNRGATVPLGSSPCEVKVRALMVVDGEHFASPPATVMINSTSQARIRYTVSSSPGIGPLGGRAKRLTVTAESDVSARIVMVAAPGLVMPSEPSDGLTILDKPLELTGGRPQSYIAKVPSAIGKPYWVRCFLVSGNAQMADPPLTTLKEG